MSKDITIFSKETTFYLRSHYVPPDQPKAHTAKHWKYKCFTNAHLQLPIELHGVTLRLGTPCNHSLPIVIRHHTAFVRMLSGLIEAVFVSNASYCKPSSCYKQMRHASVQASNQFHETCSDPGAPRAASVKTSASHNLCKAATV